MAKPPSDMLSADELEALRRSAKSQSEYFRRALGRIQSAEEIEQERRDDEWWANYLRKMREEEAKLCKG
jgi:hypothetical protein